MLEIREASGRAMCRFCHMKIAKGDIEVVAKLGNPYGAQAFYPSHYHLFPISTMIGKNMVHCDGFIEKYKSFFEELLLRLQNENLKL